MTSFTKALYRRDPGAAEAYYRHSTFEARCSYGRIQSHVPGFESAFRDVPRVFGKRHAAGAQACQEPCGHPACSQGCVIFPGKL